MTRSPFLWATAIFLRLYWSAIYAVSFLSSTRIQDAETHQRSNVTLDATRSKTDDENGRDETTQTSAMLQGSRNGGANHDQQSDQVDAGEQHDSLVFAQVLIGHDGAKNGSDCLLAYSLSPQGEYSP